MLKRAAAERGNSIEALYDLARVHFATDDYNKGRNACRPLVAKAPENAFSNLCMAQAFLTWRRATRAAEFVDKARASAPDQPEVYQVLGDLKRIGRVGAKALIYFEVVTTLALLIGLVVANTFTPGAGFHANPATLDASKVAKYGTAAQQMSTLEFFLHIIPKTWLRRMGEPKC